MVTTVRAKVRHGLIWWRPDPKNPSNEDKAFRNMTVDLPKGEYDRLYALGAVVPATEELVKPGKMITLPETATDEEIMAWVTDATTAEIRDLAAQRPMLADRLRVARGVIEDRLRKQYELLGAAIREADDAVESRSPVADGEAEVNPAVDGSPLGDPDDGDDDDDDGDDEDDDDGDDEDLDEDPDTVVSWNVKKIQQHLSKHPEQASAIMQAENRLAEEEDRDPRQGVIRSVEVAASHQSQ